MITDTFPISRPRITLAVAGNKLLNSSKGVRTIGAAALYMAGFVGCTSTAACAYSMMLAVQSTFTDSKRNYWQFGWDVSYVGLCYFSARAYQTTVVPAQRLKAELLDYVGCSTNKPEYENDTISLKAGLIDASKKFFFGDVFARLEEEKMTKEKLMLEKVALENSAREKEQDFNKREEIWKRQLKELQDEKREQEQKRAMSEILQLAKVLIVVGVGATAIGLCMRGACHWKYFRVRGRLRESLRINKDLTKSNMVQREKLKKLESAICKKDNALKEQEQASKDAIAKAKKENEVLEEQLQVSRDANGQKDKDNKTFKGPPGDGQVLRSAESGIRVRRGPDWEWDDLDRGGLGTTMPHDVPGGVRVRWDRSDRTGSYRVGIGGKHDLIVAGDIHVGSRVKFTRDIVRAPGWNFIFSVGRTHFVGEIRGAWFRPSTYEFLWAPLGGVQPIPSTEVLRSAQVGVRVMRGPDWEDFGEDGSGFGTTVESSSLPGYVYVSWDHGGLGEYRVGAKGKYDLCVRRPGSMKRCSRW